MQSMVCRVMIGGEAVETDLANVAASEKSTLIATEKVALIWLPVQGKWSSLDSTKHFL